MYNIKNDDKYIVRLFDQTIRREERLLQLRISVEQGKLKASMHSGFARSFGFCKDDVAQIAEKLSTVINPDELENGTEIMSLSVKSGATSDGEEVEYSEELKAIVNKELCDRELSRIVNHTVMKAIFLKAGVGEKELKDAYYASL